MTIRPHVRQLALAACVLAFSTLTLAHTWAQDSGPTKKESIMTARAQGTFEVDMQPLAEDEGWGGFARMSIDK